MASKPAPSQRPRILGSRTPGHFKLRYDFETPAEVEVTVRCAFCGWYVKTTAARMAGRHSKHLCPAKRR